MRITPLGALCLVAGLAACATAAGDGFGPLADDVSPDDGSGASTDRPSGANGGGGGGSSGGGSSGGAGGASSGASGGSGSSDAGSDASVLVDAGDAGTVGSDDPFEASSCTGPVLSTTRAEMLLGGATRVTLAATALQHRTRVCNAGVCGAWSAPALFERTYVVYSGGVTTRYKKFAFPTTLVLWKSGSTFTLSVRHTPDVTQCPTCDTRGTRFVVSGATPIAAASNQFYLWDPAPSNPYDYQDLPIYFPGATLSLDAHESCARYRVETETEQIVGLYEF